MQYTKFSFISLKQLQFIPLIILLVLTGCQPAWQIEVNNGGDISQQVDQGQWREWQNKEWEGASEEKLPLEYILASLDYGLIDTINFHSKEGKVTRFEWRKVADDAWWFSDGKVEIAGIKLTPASISVEPPLSYFQVNASITDIAPTAASILGIPAPAQATGSILSDRKSNKVMLLFLDAFGYQRYLKALDDGSIPFISSLEPPLMALTTYPPITRVSSASVLTGAPPAVHGVDARETRKTETETLFDVAVKNGLTVTAVEGESLPFEMRNAAFKLSGDRNGNGLTDDEVLANALAVLEAGAPDLMWVHFHGIDDAGHEYGPGAAQEIEVVRAVDQAVMTLIEAAPTDLTIIIFADHGQHLLGEIGEGGNHGNLIEEDMLIPIFILYKD